MATLGPAPCVSAADLWCPSDMHVLQSQPLLPPLLGQLHIVMMQMCLLASLATAASCRGRRRTLSAPPASSSGRSPAWRCSSTGPWCCGPTTAGKVRTPGAAVDRIANVKLACPDCTLTAVHTCAVLRAQQPPHRHQSLLWHALCAAAFCYFNRMTPVPLLQAAALLSLPSCGARGCLCPTR